MNRRDFLKSLAAGMAVAAIPSLVTKTESAVVYPDNWADALRHNLAQDLASSYNEEILAQFKNGEEYGNMIRFSSASDETVRHVIDSALLPDIKKHMVKGTRYELLVSEPRDFGRWYSVAWYADKDMQTQSNWEQAIAIDNPELMKERGVLRIGRLVV